jgi:hypothetical protein
MTDVEALTRSRAIARARRWRWREPARVLTRQNGLAGRRVCVVLTTPDGRACRVRIEFDLRTGALILAEYERT